MLLNPTKANLGDIQLTQIDTNTNTAKARIYTLTGWSDVWIPVVINNLIAITGETPPNHVVVRY